MLAALTPTLPPRERGWDEGGCIVRHLIQQGQATTAYGLNRWSYLRAFAQFIENALVFHGGGISHNRLAAG